jgi:outer membrane protein assembly factor BamB
LPRDPQVLLYVGIKNAVVALDERTGEEVWRAAQRGADHVSVLWDGTSLFAGNRGEVFRLDPRSGAVLWRNELKGLGWGLVSLASGRAPGTAGPTGGDTLTAAKRRRDAQHSAAT